MLLSKANTQSAATCILVSPTMVLSPRDGQRATELQNTTQNTSQSSPPRAQSLQHTWDNILP